MSVWGSEAIDDNLLSSLFSIDRISGIGSFRCNNNDLQFCFEPSCSIINYVFKFSLINCLQVFWDILIFGCF